MQSRAWEKVMTRHSTSFEPERPLSAEIAKALIVETNSTPNSTAMVSAAAEPHSANRLRRLLIAGVATAVLAGGSWLGWNYWTVGRFLVSTDDAYVQADNTTIAPRISGYLSEVLVGDNERTAAGQVLARIDDRDFKVALDQARADVAAAQAAIASKQAQLDVQQAIIEAAQATVAVDAANKMFASEEHKRYADLAATGYGSVQNAQAARSRNDGAGAAIRRDEANLASAIKNVDLLRAELAQAVAAAERAAALQRQAELNLSYTTITSPIAGVVGNRTLRTGQYVSAGAQLMALVPISGAYVVANYKETQLTHVERGQAVTIQVDTYPGQTVLGHVDSVAPASGQEFALLPPDNATGNFTKVVQRIPVKIAIDGGSPVELRPGMSVIPTIQTLAAKAREEKAHEASTVADVIHR
jgi:membrane fusion protein (multidrug efflux system)